LPGALGASGEFQQGSTVYGCGAWQWSGELELATGDISGRLRLLVGIQANVGTSYSPHYSIQLDLDTLEWEIFVSDATVYNSIAGPFTLPDPHFGFRIEQKRYIFRVRIWDAGGAEPGTWDFEDFYLASDGVTAYPYSDNEATAQTVNSGRVFVLQINNDLDFGGTYPYEVHIHSMRLEHDPYGDPDDGYVRVERPEGESLGDITIPWGCPYMVYWGRRDWTEADSADSGTAPELEFSARWWNDPSAAELQRLVTYFYWFRSLHGGGVVSMNWSSDQNADVVRIHELLV
jgi:hypothetical protein